MRDVDERHILYSTVYLPSRSFSSNKDFLSCTSTREKVQKILYLRRVMVSTLGDAYMPLPEISRTKVRIVHSNSHFSYSVPSTKLFVYVGRIYVNGKA